MTLRVNVDLNSANNAGSGIAVFENEIVSRLVDAPGLVLHGCANWQRAFVASDFSRFNIPVTYSAYPYRLAYGYAMPITYEFTMGSDADVNFSCTYRQPLLRFRAPLVSTIHDTILLRVGEDRVGVEKHAEILRHTVAVSDRIITVSESSRRDIVDLLGVDQERVHVVNNGVDLERFSAPLNELRARAVRERYGLPARYVLYFGGNRPHKNLRRLIEAYALLPADLRHEFGLVLTCTDSALRARAEELGIVGQVTFTGFISDEDLDAVYRLASALAYVSLYEGFGIPVIEAQAAGVPVITSNTSSLPEVAGGAALLVDPLSIEDISSAILRVLSSSDVALRMRRLGLKNSERFTWDRAAALVADILRLYER